VTSRPVASALALALCTTSLAAIAQDIRTEKVHFPAGKTGATISGTIVGYKSVSYVLGAEAGQTMTVVLKPSNLATYFNVYEPGKKPSDQALASGDRTGEMVPDLNRFKGKLPTSGEYIVSVYMYRAAARRNERSSYTLEISISPQGDVSTRPPVSRDYADGLQGGPDYWDVKTARPGTQINLRAAPSTGANVLRQVADGTALRNLGCRMAEGRRWCKVETLDAARVSGWVAGDFLRESSHSGATAPSGDAKVPGTPFHATGEIPCARTAGQTTARCKFGVVRKGNGNAAVTVFWPDGGSRVITFENGIPASFDRSQADGDARMIVNRNADLFMISIGDQRFEIFDAIVNGG
jgi:hypothetical protein